MPGTSEYEVRISNYAFSNLEEIFRYIAFTDQRPDTAAQVISAIEEKILKNIPDHPYYYPECASRRTRKKIYRQALCKNYRIIFRIDENIISIIGIVHASRGTDFIKSIPSKS